MLGLWCAVVLALAGFQVEANIAGTVKDESQAVVAGANVTLRNQQTGAVRETATNDRGDYAVPLLSPGVYQLAIEKPGFRRAVSSDIRLNVGEAVRFDVTLAVGDIRTTVEILESIPFLQTDTSALGQVIDDIKISELPLNERNFLQFTLLVPGAQPPADGSQNSSEFIGGAISVNGAREQSNNFLLDGIDNNGMLINQYSVLPSVDAIREFKVQSGNSAAEYGRSGGAQINIILKSGANQFHGSAFEFLRNRKLDAKNFFDPPDCTSSSIQGTCGDIPRFDRNQFGGTLGGPIKKDKTFFFGSYEGLRLRQAVTRRATVPSQVERQAALASLPALIRNPAGEAILNLYPRANVGPDLATSNTFVASPVARNTVNQALGKLDHQLTRTDSLSGHYAFYETKRVDPYALLNPFTNLPGYGSNKEIESQSGRTTWTRIVNPRWINEARGGFNRRSYTFRNENSGIDKAKTIGFPTISPRSVDWGYPNVTIPGFDGIGESIVLPQDSIETTFQLADSIAWNPSFDGGRHSFKFGSDFRYQRMDLFLDVYSRGNWFFLGVVTGNPLQDLLLGAPTFALASTGDTNTLQRTNALNFYFQDDYRVSKRLTLNLGLRYEYNSPAVDTRDRFTVPDFSAKSLTCSPKPDCQFIRAGTNGVPRATYERDLNNFAPRIGFAWKPFGGNRFVVRSAYGIFYDVAILNRSVFPRLNPPFFGINVFVNNGRNSIQDIVNQPIPSPPQVGMIDPNTREGYMQHWNLDLQHEIARDFAIDIAYAGSKGTKLAKHIDFNEAPPGAARPYPQFGPIRYITAGASSDYHALQMRAEKRFSRGLTFLSAYTWSKSIDDASALFGSAGEPSIPQDSHNLSGERALSDFHSAHRFVLSYLQEVHLFGNWQLGAIWTMQSGRPFTINRAIDQSGTGTDLDFSDRPDQISDPDQAGPVANNPDPLCRRTISQGGRAADVVHDARSWFNPCAFAAPSTMRFGTAGRNSVIGPDFKNVDFSVTRKFSLAESRSLETRLEFFNIFNHPNFDIPNRSFDSPTFGAVQSSNAFGTRPSRQIQIGLRYVF